MISAKKLIFILELYFLSRSYGNVMTPLIPNLLVPQLPYWGYSPRYDRQHEDRALYGGCQLLVFIPGTVIFDRAYRRW